MRLILLFAVLSLFANELVAQHIHYDVFTAIQKNPNQYHAVYVTLKDFPNLEEMRSDALRRRMHPVDRAQMVKEVLQETANRSQRPFMEKLLAISPAVDMASLRELWVCNGVYVRIKGSAIEEISKWPEVEGIYPEVIAETQHQVSAQAAMVAPNGSEPGLRAIGAQEMWKMGYTGYGTKAVIFDSGEDWNHPAIKEQFYGLYVPVDKAWSAPSSNPFDVGGHGTHVTGTICGLDRLRNDTIGVAFNAMWIGAPVQFGNSAPQPLPVLDFLANMQFSIDPNGDGTDLPDVINNSWSGGGFTDCTGNSAFSRTIRTAEASGIAVVWAAGNQGPDFSTVRGYQTNNYNLLTGFSVGATSPISPYIIADFSSRGPSLCGGDGALATKPEVSAPGVNIRSCVLNGAYSNFQGTSMASPHVAGAVLLLKEAYPYLSGEEILMALYDSAIDLGEPGEDNAYGRGFINLPAAFNYLKNQGFDPVPPRVPTIDALVVGVQTASGRDCNRSISLDLVVENSGLEPLRSMDISAIVQLAQQECVQTIRWEGELAPGARETIALDLKNCDQFTTNGYYRNGVYEISIDVQLDENIMDERPLNNRTRMELRISGDRPMTVATEGLDVTAACRNTSVILEAHYDGPGQIEWYDRPDGTQPLHIGPRFETTVLGKEARYYPRPEIRGIGMKNYTEGEFSSIAPETGETMYFDVHEYLVLRSVTVYGSRQGVFSCKVCDPNGNCTQFSRVIRAGANIIPIQVNLTPGANWSIVNSGQATPYYTVSDVRFPYHYENLLTIKGTNHPENAYLYFYDWNIAFSNPCPVNPVRVEMLPVLNSPVVEISAPDTLILQSINEFNPGLTIEYASEWTMDFGDGYVVSDERFPSHKYQEAGNYMLKLTARSNEGCMHIVRKPITVLDDAPSSAPELSGMEQAQVIYPNPGADFFWLDSQEAGGIVDAIINVQNALGQTVLTKRVSGALPLQIETTALVSGLYRVHVMSGNAGKTFIWVKS
jgi:subtilisin family serine protease/PKD repeat protein